MPRLTARDLATIAALVALAAVLVVLVVLGHSDWALIVLAGMVALLGVVSRVEFATRRRDLRSQLKDARDARRTLDLISTTIATMRTEVIDMTVTQRRVLPAVRKEMASLGTDVSGVATELVETRAALRKRTVELAASVSALRAEVKDSSGISGDQTVERMAQDLAAVRAEIRGMRVAQQLLSQTITSTKDDVVSSANAIGEMRESIKRFER